MGLFTKRKIETATFEVRLTYPMRVSYEPQKSGVDFKPVFVSQDGDVESGLCYDNSYTRPSYYYTKQPSLDGQLVRWNIPHEFGHILYEIGSSGIGLDLDIVNFIKKHRDFMPIHDYDETNRKLNMEEKEQLVRQLAQTRMARDEKFIREANDLNRDLGTLESELVLTVEATSERL